MVWPDAFITDQQCKVAVRLLSMQPGCRIFRDEVSRRRMSCQNRQVPASADVLWATWHVIGCLEECPDDALLCAGVLYRLGPKEPPSRGIFGPIQDCAH